MLELPLPPDVASRVIAKAVLRMRATGGPGSGNFGHSGRPGEQGGSSAEGSEQIENILGGKKIGRQLGSNPGGVYQAKDGSKWYVKHYKDENQAYGEHAANALYAELGVGASRSVIGVHDGETVYASRWLEGKGTLADVGLTRDNANAILDGFAADAFTGNWDAVGTGLDNILILPDGGVSRIDSGGAFLHRAQGAPKPEATLPEVKEWDTLASKQTAPYYSMVFRKAGLENADALGERGVRQIDKILGVREKHGSWKEFVDKRIPGAAASYRAKLSSTLEKRTESLRSIRERLSKRLTTAGGAGSGHFGHESVEGQLGGSAPGAGGGKNKPASKEQLGKLADLHAQGWKAAKIASELGMHPNTVAHKIAAIKKKEAAIKQMLSTPSAVQPATAPAPKPAPVVAPATPAAVATPTAQVTGGATPQEAGVLIETTGAVLYLEGNLPVAKDTGALQPSVKLASELGYKWAEKTTGPQAGKFAWFKDGVQVSAPAQKFEAEKAASSMHYGKGPVKPEQVAPATDWPVSQDTERFIGKNYPNQVEAHYNGWKASLSSQEHHAIGSYTGNGYASMNKKLRDEGHFSPNAKALQNALERAPSPPPPDLVWRGLSSHGQFSSKLNALAVGDKIKMDGFQSTSINPSMPSGHGVLLEIRPKAGAYVRPISSHKSEWEYLMPHGRNYTVKGISYVKIKYGDSYHEGKTTTKRVIQLEMH
jgi:ADP-ribosyltransferase exoenzyme